MKGRFDVEMEQKVEKEKEQKRMNYSLIKANIFEPPKNRMKLGIFPQSKQPDFIVGGDQWQLISVDRLPSQSIDQNTISLLLRKEISK